MKMLRFTSAVMFLALVGSAAAQLIPPSPTATLVNFDNIPLGPDQMIPFAVVTTEYTDSAGVTFAGFGQNAGGLFNPSFTPSDVPYISLPNNLYFVSAFPVVTGGLAQTPETLSFYPPILSFQFDTGSLGADCGGTSIVHAQGFDASNVSVGTASVTASLEGNTLAITFSAPASKVVVTSSHTCGPPGSLFFGVEVFSMDNIAFVPEPAAASQCAQAIIDAAGKKAKAEASCNAKALQNGVPVDPACIQKASDAFTKAFTKAQTKGDCLTIFDEGSTEAAVDTFIASAVQAVAGTSPGPDVCFGKKLTAVGKKGQSIAKCFSTAAKKGVVPDPNCGTKAANSFNGALKKCGTPTQLGPVEAIVDQFGVSLNRSLTVPTTTTTTAPETTTTTTTLPPPLGEHLAFTTTAGTANCGNGGLSSPPDPPFSGELDSDTAGTTKITDLGLGCLYIGGGSATVAPSLIPEGATTILDSSDGTTLTASFGTSRADCSRGPESATHCITDPTIACTTDSDCTGLKGDCAPDANCFFGPPIPINGFPPSCVVNTFASDASGTVDVSTGVSSVSIDLSSRVFLTLGQLSTCPSCAGGFCDSGQNAGQACVTTNAGGTSTDCPPSVSLFVGAIPVNLTPLNTETQTSTAADGNFCSPQGAAGAFGQVTAEAITQHGSPAGDLSDGQPHASTLVSNFCIPATGSGSLDGLASLPGPGSLSLPGMAQFVASPSGAFLN
jgi:hypothetical protein